MSNVEWTAEMAGILRAERGRIGWSRLTLAAKAGVSERTIVDLEGNKRSGQPDGGLRPRKPTVSRVASALDSPELASLANVPFDRAGGAGASGGTDATAVQGADALFRHGDRLTPDQRARVQGYIDALLDES